MTDTHRIHTKDIHVSFRCDTCGDAIKLETPVWDAEFEIHSFYIPHGVCKKCSKVKGDTNESEQDKKIKSYENALSYLQTQMKNSDVYRKCGHEILPISSEIEIWTALIKATLNSENPIWSASSPQKAE